MPGVAFIVCIPAPVHAPSRADELSIEPAHGICFCPKKNKKIGSLTRSISGGQNMPCQVVSGSTMRL
jgi:hypothetical protein